MRTTIPVHAFATVLSCGLFCSSLAINLWAQSGASASQEKPRVYVTDSTSWETSAAAAGSDSGFGAGSSGGARPQTAEIVKTFGERCPQVMINNRRDMSDYIVQLDHEGGKSPLAHKNKVAVFVKSTGDSIFSKSTLSLGGSVQDACAAIVNHWNMHAAELKPAAPAPSAMKSSEPSAGAVSTQTAPAKLNIASNPAGADIEINGSFVGNTPSSIELSPGEQSITISKRGYQPWNRKIKITGGTINVNIDLEKLPTGE